MYIFIMEILSYLYYTWRWPHMSYFVSCLFMAIVLLCIWDCYIYLQLCAEFDYCIVLIGWLVLPLDSSSLHFQYGLIMYFGHRMTPLTSHIRRHLLQLILPHMVNHTFMAFPVPMQIPQTPWTIFVPLMFPRSSLKTCLICYTRLLNPLSRIYAGLTSKTAYIGMCTKIQIILEFSLTWIRITCLLAFHMP